MSAAAAADVIPLVPVHVPPLRPATRAVNSSDTDSPAVTVMPPVPTSTSPPALGSRPPTVVSRYPATASVPPATTFTRLAPRAVACESASTPPCTEVDPENVFDEASASVPPPVFTKRPVLPVITPPNVPLSTDTAPPAIATVPPESVVMAAEPVAATVSTAAGLKVTASSTPDSTQIAEVVAKAPAAAVRVPFRTQVPPE